MNVFGNDYTWIEEKRRSFTREYTAYDIAVSIVIPVYNRNAALGKSLAALTHQTYPRHLMQIVVADDGSTENVPDVLQRYNGALNLAYVRQADRGYRLAAVRNLAVRSARHDHIILLDCDIIPVPELVEAFAQYFHATDQAILLGLRRFIDARGIAEEHIVEDIQFVLGLQDTLSANPIFQSFSSNGRTVDWRIDEYQRTRCLKDSIFPFRSLVGANAAFPRAAFDAVGGFCEDFTAWGGEDAEFGMRLYNQGYYFVPVDQAVGLHQEGEGEPIDRRAGLKVTNPLMADKCPIPFFRKKRGQGGFEVPKISVIIDARTVNDLQIQLESILTQAYRDFEVLVLGTMKPDMPANVRCIDVRTSLFTRDVIDQSRGMYLAFVQPGQCMRPNVLERAAEYLDQHNVGGIVIDDTPTSHRVDAYSKSTVSVASKASVHLVRRREWARLARKVDLTRTVHTTEFMAKLGSFGEIVQLCTDDLGQPS